MNILYLSLGSLPCFSLFGINFFRPICSCCHRSQRVLVFWVWWDFVYCFFVFFFLVFLCVSLKFLVILTMAYFKLYYSLMWFLNLVRSDENKMVNQIYGVGKKQVCRCECTKRSLLLCRYLLIIVLLVCFTAINPTFAHPWIWPLPWLRRQQGNLLLDSYKA